MPTAAWINPPRVRRLPLPDRYWVGLDLSTHAGLAHVFSLSVICQSSFDRTMCAIRQINLVNTGRLNEFGYGTFLWVFVAGHF
jgi:hypothetical protein